MAKTSTAKKENPLGPFGYVDELTLGERVALAAASMAIHELPSFLQQGSDAADMQAMLVDPSSCGRGGYILAKALAIFNSFSGFREGALDDIDGEGKSDKYFLEGCEKSLVQDPPARAHNLVGGFDHVHRNADGARLVGGRAGDRLPDPPGGVGQNL